MIETATYIGLVDFSKLINRTVYAPMLRHFGTTNTVSNAEVSKTLRHWCRSVSNFFAGAEGSTRHFGVSVYFRCDTIDLSLIQ